MLFPDWVLYPLIVLVPPQRKKLICGPHLIAVGQSEDYGSITVSPIIAPIHGIPMPDIETREAVLIGQRDVLDSLVHTQKHRALWTYFTLQRVKKPREASLDVWDHGGLAQPRSA
jgi:hypothetical protein